MQARAKINPEDVRPLNAWALVREDPPRRQVGLLVIPDSSRYKGRTQTIATVISVPGPIGRDREGKLWEMPPVGSRVVIPAIAHRPDTQVGCQELFAREGDDGRYFFVHAMDLNLVLELEEGEAEPEVE